MSIQQSINQSILAAGALYSQSGAAEQRKGKLELERDKKNLKAANKKYDELQNNRTSEEQVRLSNALDEYRMKKAENMMNLGLKSGDFESYQIGSRKFKELKEKLEGTNKNKASQSQEASENAPPADYDPEWEDELAKRQERQAVDEYEMAAQKEKDRREKRIMMRQANRAAVQKRMEMLSDRDFRQDMFGGN